MVFWGTSCLIAIQYTISLCICEGWSFSVIIFVMCSKHYFWFYVTVKDAFATRTRTWRCQSRPCTQDGEIHLLSLNVFGDKLKWVSPCCCLFVNEIAVVGPSNVEHCSLSNFLRSSNPDGIVVCLAISGLCIIQLQGRNSLSESVSAYLFLVITHIHANL